ncbi:MAG: VWA domain-containing protein [Chthoniobacterales bacterium]|nr:VWA domain-containing protein [Chthoniobacterales bacterium]
MASAGVDQVQKSKIESLSQGWGNGGGSGRGGVSRSRQVGFANDSGALLVRPGDFNTEAYNATRENVFLAAQDNPLSTFSIDVDTASYSNVRRFLQGDQLPPAGAIRTEELLNYFRYDYPQPEGSAPFSVTVAAARAPWDSRRELVQIGLKGRETHASERAPANLVFLIDSSGSMNSPDKLPLLQRSLRALVENLSPKDRVAVVAYAGSSGLVLPSTPGTKKQEIIDAFTNLSAGGSTHGSEGIRLAYEVARENFLKEGSNRVILCTDGDFNVGVTDQSELQRLIEKERASGVFLSVLGFGTGNLKDSTMELLADKGNGNYAYIDSLTEGRKVLVEEMGSTLFTIAKDVKIQVEFNPARVAGYRLIGYENRLLAKEDFNDDKKDAGEIGEGHTVTALYEIIPAGQAVPGQPSVDPLKYRKPEGAVSASSDELLTVKLRYKAPDGDKSELLEVPFGAKEIPDFGKASDDFRFASAVAAFGMKLRNSPEQGDISWDDIQKIARGSLGEDAGSYRAEFLTLIERAKALGAPQQ